MSEIWCFKIPRGYTNNGCTRNNRSTFIIVSEIRSSNCFFIGKLIECEIEIDYCEMTVVNAQHLCE